MRAYVENLMRSRNTLRKARHFEAGERYIVQVIGTLYYATVLSFVDFAFECMRAFDVRAG